MRFHSKLRSPERPCDAMATDQWYCRSEGGEEGGDGGCGRAGLALMGIGQALGDVVQMALPLKLPVNRPW